MGRDNNDSWNMGAEGPTDDPEINRLARAADAEFSGDADAFAGRSHADGRRRDRANSQKGNNNAYCQDNALTWFDWKLERGAGATEGVYDAR